MTWNIDGAYECIIDNKEVVDRMKGKKLQLKLCDYNAPEYEIYEAEMYQLDTTKASRNGHGYQVVA